MSSGLVKREVGGEADGAWIQCRIGWSRDRWSGQFVAVYQGAAPLREVGRSERFPWLLHTSSPPDDRRTRARLDELCRLLEESGWERHSTDDPDPWYEFRYRCAVASEPGTVETHERDGMPLSAVGIVPEQANAPADAVEPDEESGNPWWAGPTAMPVAAPTDRRSDLFERVAAYTWRRTR